MNILSSIICIVLCEKVLSIEQDATECSRVTTVTLICKLHNFNLILYNILFEFLTQIYL